MSCYCRCYDGLSCCYDPYSCPTGILAIAKQCAVVVDVKELFGAERKGQVYAHLHELLAKKERSLIGRVKWYFCMKTCDNMVQLNMLLSSTKVVIGNQSLAQKMAEMEMIVDRFHFKNPRSIAILTTLTTLR